MSGQRRAPKTDFRPEYLPFSTEGLTVQEVVERADAMARRYQVRIGQQLTTINRFLDHYGHPDDVKAEIARLHEELAKALVPDSD